MAKLYIMDFVVGTMEEITRALKTMEMYQVIHTPGKTNRAVFIDLYGHDDVHEYDNASGYDRWNYQFIENDSLREFIKQILYGA